MKERERMLISAHLDGEVNAPWNAALDAKIASDPVWAQEYERQQKVKAALLSSAEPDFSKAAAAVLARMEIRRPTARVSRMLPTLWVTAAAAALILVSAGSGFLLGRSSLSESNSVVAELKVQVPKQLELKLSGEGQLLMASTLQGSRP